MVKLETPNLACAFLYTTGTSNFFQIFIRCQSHRIIYIEVNQIKIVLEPHMLSIVDAFAVANTVRRVSLSSDSNFELVFQVNYCIINDYRAT